MMAVTTTAIKQDSRNEPRWIAPALAAAAVITVIYWQPFQSMYRAWNLVDSYYSHGMLIPPICAFLVWLRRKELLEAPAGSSPLGYPLILMAAGMLTLGGFLGFGVFQDFSLIPMLFGASLIFLGFERTKVLWFPLAFLTAMIPLPGSVTQMFSFELKMFAARSAMVLVDLTGLPMVQQGSFIHFKNDQMLIGDVCGGLRSLIALLAIGVLMAYFSHTKAWARVVILAMSGPIAVIANVVRIFILCVAGYYYGSDFAAGRFHDISGVFIFASAFILFFTLEGLLRWLGRKEEPEGGASGGNPEGAASQ